MLLALASVDRAQREREIDKAAETADPERLVALISVDDAIRRNAALEALTKGGRRSVPALVRALRDPDPEVVMFAASTLGKTRDRSAIPHLAAILKHADVNVCQAAVESLGELRAVSTLDTLVELLQGHTWLRFAVVHTLGEIADPRSIPTLLRLLGDEQLRDSAIAALGKIGGLEAIDALVRQLEASRSSADFRFCLEALGSALVQLADPAVLLRLPAWMALARQADAKVADRLKEILRLTGQDAQSPEALMTKEAAIDLVRCLRLESCYPAMIATASDRRLSEVLLFAAAEIGAALEPQLTAALSHDDGEIRRFACRGLAAVSGESSAKAVASLLTDEEDTIRAAAVGVLGRLHLTEALPGIVARLADDSKAVRRAVLQALARMDARLVTIALLRNPQVLAERHLDVLSIMRNNPHPLQRGFVETSLAHANEQIRGAAVAAFAAQGSDLVETLEPMLADRSAEVRRSAISALSRCPSERTRQLLLGLLDRDGEARAEVIRALGKVGDARVVPKVIAIFDSCTPEEQVYAIDVLETLEPPGAEPFLARQLDHQDPRVRRHAVKALVRIGTTSALRRIAIALRDDNPRVRMTVSKALASCPHPIARNSLERLSVDPVDSVAAFARSQL
ncbi:MAG TPA: HEAT repeat domain-containing protein [Polyangia bacterium]